MPEGLIEAITLIIVAIIEAIAARERKEDRKQREEIRENAKIRKEESRLSMQMMDATLQLSIVSSNALTNGHNNGNVERAREAAERAKDEYNSFLMRVASAAVSA